MSKKDFYSPAELVAAAEEFCKEWPHFLSKINFDTSFFDARAIRFFNEVPGKIAKAINFKS